jgi:hypothetical protein
VFKRKLDLACNKSSSIAPSRTSKPLSLMLLFDFDLLAFFDAFFWAF